MVHEQGHIGRIALAIQCEGFAGAPAHICKCIDISVTMAVSPLVPAAATQHSMLARASALRGWQLESTSWQLLSCTGPIDRSIEAACEKPGATAESSRTRQDIQVQAPSQTPSLCPLLYPAGMEACGRRGPAASKFLKDLWDPC